MAFARGAQPGRGAQAVLSCEILNRMTAPSRHSVISHRQVRIPSVRIVRASHDSCNDALDEELTAPPRQMSSTLAEYLKTTDVEAHARFTVLRAVADG